MELDFGYWQDLSNGQVVHLLWRDGTLFVVRDQEAKEEGKYPYAAIALLLQARTGFLFGRYEKL